MILKKATNQLQQSFTFCCPDRCGWPGFLSSGAQVLPALWLSCSQPRLTVRLSLPPSTTAPLVAPQAQAGAWGGWLRPHAWPGPSQCAPPAPAGRGARVQCPLALLSVVGAAWCRVRHSESILHGIVAHRGGMITEACFNGQVAESAHLGECGQAPGRSPSHEQLTTMG